MDILLVPILILSFPVICYCQAGRAITYRRGDVQHGNCVNKSFVYDEFRSNSMGSCALICASRTLCKSLNFYGKDNTCQLNAITLKENSSGMITARDAIYLDKRDIKRNDQCSKITCADTEECVINQGSAVCSKLNQKKCPSVFPNPPCTIVSTPCKTTPGSMCSLTCYENFHQSSASDNSGLMICLSSGKWSVLDPQCKVCKRIHDCSDLRSIGYKTSGVYNIIVKREVMEAYCDMETEGGGWTVVMKRVDGSLNFNQNWNKYKYGFGSARGEYWLGNEYLHTLTWGRNYGVYFKLQTWKKKWYWAWYPRFLLYPENKGYMIYLMGYKGNAGQRLYLSNSGGSIQDQRFTTRDRDQDDASGNQAFNYGGGWWYNRWAYCALTGTYGSNKFVWNGIGKLRASTIMVRPRQ